MKFLNRLARPFLDSEDIAAINSGDPIETAYAWADAREGLAMHLANCFYKVSLAALVVVSAAWVYAFSILSL